MLSKISAIDAKKDIQDLRKAVDEIKDGLDFINTEVEELKAELPETEKRLNGKIYELDRQNALLQAYVARENLVVVGVPEQKNENGREDTELVFNKFVKENLEIEDKME